MKLLIDKEKCTGCKTCVSVCPQMILEVVDEIAQVKDIQRCMGCFGCEVECEEGAIRLMRAPQSVDNIEVEPPPANITECDVAIVGAGPAGLGAAITCARAGLDVVVFDKLPNRQVSHHNDGGVMTTLPGVSSIKVGKDQIDLPELDISLDGKIANKLSYLGILGPNGLSTGDKFPRDLDAFVQSKTEFLKELIKLAESAGAKIWFNAKVTDILKDGERINGIKIDTGQEIPAKVVVTADGVAAEMSEKAGFPISMEEPLYVSALRYHFEKDTETLKNLPMGYHYLIGGLDPEEGMKGGFVESSGTMSVTDGIHISIGMASKKKGYPAPKPLDFYVEEFIKNDPRFKKVFGSELDGKKPSMLLGFRVRSRKTYLGDRVGEGVICVGDAWVDEADLGNIPSLANGVHAGRTIVEAAKKGDFSKAALEPANQFVSSEVERYISGKKKFLLAAAVLTKEEIEEYFKYLPWMDYPSFTFGRGKHKTLAYTKYTIGNFFRLINLKKYPNLKKYVL